MPTSAFSAGVEPISSAEGQGPSEKRSKSSIFLLHFLRKEAQQLSPGQQNTALTMVLPEVQILWNVITRFRYMVLCRIPSDCPSPLSTSTFFSSPHTRFMHMQKFTRTSIPSSEKYEGSHAEATPDKRSDGKILRCWPPLLLFIDLLCRCKTARQRGQ